MFRETVSIKKGKNLLILTRGNTSLERAYVELMLLLWLIILLFYYSLTDNSQLSGLYSAIAVLALMLYTGRIGLLFSGVSLELDRQKMSLTVETISRGRRRRESFTLATGGEIGLHYTAQTVHGMHAVGVRRTWSILVPRQGAEPYTLDFAREHNAVECAEETARFLSIPLRDRRGTADKVLQPAEVGISLTAKRNKGELHEEHDVPLPRRVREIRTKEGVTFLLPPVGYRSGLGFLLILNHGILIACVAGMALGKPHATLSQAASNLAPHLVMLCPLVLISVLGFVTLLTRPGIAIDRNRVRRFHLFAGIRYAWEEIPLAQVLAVVREPFHAMICETLSIQGKEKIVKVRGFLAPHEQEGLALALERAIRDYGR